MNARIAYIGLGSNLEDPQQQLDRATQALGSITGTRLLRQSSRYRTAPWGDTAQPDFVNAVAEIETGLDARVLLQELLRIELQLGRQRDGRRWGPRIIDLDLLIYGDERLDLEDLVVPHPRMGERAFVLLPLSELAPDRLISGDSTVSECLSRLDVSGCQRL